MNDRPKIIVGLVVGLVGLSFPLWYPLASGRPAGPPDLELPPGGTRCVEDAPTMRARHTELLRHWRDSVVRDNNKFYVSKTYGDRCEMSLSKTCMGCHSNRETFCDRCHGYTNACARLNCWDCHVDTAGRTEPAGRAERSEARQEKKGEKKGGAAPQPTTTTTTSNRQAEREPGDG